MQVYRVTVFHLRLPWLPRRIWRPRVFVGFADTKELSVFLFLLSLKPEGMNIFTGLLTRPNQFRSHTLDRSLGIHLPRFTSEVGSLELAGAWPVNVQRSTPIARVANLHCDGCDHRVGSACRLFLSISLS